VAGRADHRARAGQRHLDDHLRGIVAGLPAAAGGTLELVRTGAMSVFIAIVIFAVVVLVTGVVVFIEKGQRRILVNYAKRQVGNRLYGGQSSFLPLKLNMSGVIPPIFASSIILFPATLASWFGSHENMTWLKDLAGALARAGALHRAVRLAIIFFCFFYTALVFNSKETADNLKKSGAFVPGHPAGRPDRALHRPHHHAAHADRRALHHAGLPAAGSPAAPMERAVLFRRHSLLITVVVTMDFMAQLQAYLMSHQYESLLKKANFKGSGFPVR
jgi:preprotein translocase subunit SecY